MPNQLHIKLSSTALGAAGCSLRLINTTVEGYRPPAISARLVYGIAVHKFIDCMYKSGGNVPMAISMAKKAFALPKIDIGGSLHLSDEKHMMTTCMNIWAEFIQTDEAFEILLVDGKPTTEVTFEIPFFEDAYLKITLNGTIDKIGQFKNGCFAIGDWKTTSSWDNRGYFAQFEMSRQLLFYVLAVKLAGAIYPDSILGNLAKQKIGIFIDAIFLKPEKNDVKVHRSPVWLKSGKEIEAFSLSLAAFCRELSQRIATGQHLWKWGLVNGSCEGKWGKCPFWNCCKSPDEVGKLLLNRDFVKTTWNPSDYNSLNDEI